MASDRSSGVMDYHSPAVSAFAITPDDANDLAVVTRGIYTGAGGSICCVLVGDTSAVTFSNVPAGAILPVRIKKVLATGTTASIGLIGLI